MSLTQPEEQVARQFDTQDDEVEVVASESYFGETTFSMRRKLSKALKAAKLQAEGAAEGLEQA